MGVGHIKEQSNEGKGHENPAHFTGLKGSMLYLISVRAHNSGGVGPASASIKMITKKPRVYLNFLIFTKKFWIFFFFFKKYDAYLILSPIFLFLQ